MKLVLWIVLLLVGFVAEAQEQQDAALQELVSQHTHRLVLDRNALDGPGATFLREQLGDTHFFLIGEEHATGDLARLAMSLWNEAHDRGYEYLAIEVGPYGTERIEALLRSPGRDALRAFQLHEDNLLTFPFVFYAEEAELLKAVVHDSRDKEHALWGLDQEFIAGGRVVLEQLAALAETDAQRSAVAVAQEQAAAELMWLGMSPAETFIPLTEAFSGNAAGEKIVEAIVLSNGVYAPFTGRGGSSYTANDIREGYMKENFLHSYKSALQRNGEKPRVVLKFGANHLVRGHSQTNVLTLGTFVQDFALVEDVKIFSVHLDCQGGLTRDPRSGETDECSSYFLGESSDLAALLPDEQMVILDLRSLRPHMKKFKDWDERSRQLVLAYDAVIAVRDVAPASVVGQENN